MGEAELFAQVALAVVVLAIVLALWLRGVPQRRASLGLALILIVVAVAQVSARARRLNFRERASASLRQATPLAERESFATSTACKSCHPGNYASWHASFHRTMTQLATPAAVLGDFERRDVTARGEVYRLERIGDEYWVEMGDPDAAFERLQTQPIEVGPPLPRVRRRVVMTTGSHHQQTYWVGSRAPHRVLNLPLVWLIEDQRWAPREDVFLRPPQRGRDMDSWNQNCVECHSTSPELMVLADVKRIAGERAAELGISCEACHGPGEAHVRANQDPLRRYMQHFSGAPDPTIVNPARLAAPASAQVCGQCHGMNLFKNEALAKGAAFVAGDDLRETRMVLRRSEPALDAEAEDWPRMSAHVRRQDAGYLDGRFWRDGMTRVSGREHNALTESACFRGGELSCLSCHSMHHYQDRSDQLARQMDSDRACTQCHASIAERIPDHTHHAAASSGSRCANCHMPHTTYGLLKAIRSHHIDSPSVARSVETGRPNACNLCHLDQTLAWSAQHLNEWFGQRPPPLSDEQRSTSAAVLWLLKGDAGQRALIAWHMSWPPAMEALNARKPGPASGTSWLTPYLAHLLSDPYAAVRYIAFRSLRRQPGFGEFRYDFVAEPALLVNAVQRAARQWLEGGGRGPGGAAQLLFDAEGRLKESAFMRLSGQRDDTPVDLRE